MHEGRQNTATGMPVLPLESMCSMRLMPRRCVLIESMTLRASLAPSLGLLLLSALWAFGWLLPDLFPHSGARTVPLPVGEAILFSVFAATTSLIAAVRRLKYPRGRHGWACAGVGVGFFVIPTTAAALAQQWISNFDEVAVLCLTAVFAVVLDPYLQNGPPRGGKAALAAALVAMAGILCLFPLEAPNSFRAGVALCVLFVTAFELAAMNCIAVRLARTFPVRSTLTMAAQASGASAFCFAVIAASSGSHPWTSSTLQVYVSRLLLVDIPGLFLLFWLLRKLAASRMTARFLLAPLFASLAGLALLPMLPPVRGMLGLLLLAGGSGWLAFAPPESGDQESISIRATSIESPTRWLNED